MSVVYLPKCRIYMSINIDSEEMPTAIAVLAFIHQAAAGNTQVTSELPRVFPLQVSPVFVVRVT